MRTAMLSHSKHWLYRGAIVTSVAWLAACGGPGDNNTGLPSTTPVASSVNVIASSAQLNSDGKTPIGVTVLVKDANNQALKNQPVTFSASSGVVTAASDTTDANGTVNATLNTSGDPTNRDITITANAGKVTGKTSVVVSGSSIAISGSSSIVFNNSSELLLKVSDAGGTGVNNIPVTITSPLGNRLAVGSQSADGKLGASTDVNGQVKVTVTGTKPGTDNIVVEALGAQKSFALLTSNSNFTFATPTASLAVPIGGTVTPVTVHWENNGQPVAGQVVNFAATRGALTASSAVTNAQGNATVGISSNQAGTSTLQASAAGGTPQTTVGLVFVAVSASRIDLQADKTTVSVFKPNSPTSVATISAVVRDASSNLVRGAKVDFSALDVTGGALNSASATTDESGVATVLYTAGSTSSEQNGVKITATVKDVNGTPVSTNIGSTIALTVGGQSLFVRLGTNNTLTGDNNVNTQTFTAIVTDAAGNPVQGQTVVFRSKPSYYEKGVFVLRGENWEPLSIAGKCISEDLNNDGILNPGEDLNTDGTLTPGGVAGIVGTAVTNAQGVATADLTYSKRYAFWVTTDIEATVKVGGSESRSVITGYNLAGVKGDYVKDTRPPGDLELVQGYLMTSTITTITNVWKATPNPCVLSQSCSVGDAANFVISTDKFQPSTQQISGPVSLFSSAPPLDSSGTYVGSRTPALCVLTDSSVGYCVTETIVTVKDTITAGSQNQVKSPFGRSASCNNAN
ncbi:hypothetical protein FNU76_09525 [Chitinimonas arctica]|uniref:Big-1 domain-containing protein n=1 Tax=Chitinimonas arctica TaxID=2594795 RepID=A0A516SEQ1_9NEIS|nr:Ig-like domain-containing protein [Chitinimonas arctica]QDQ26590.1 hypothetical protein FNU76_09525 [Chitinimonas arctica]